MDTITLNAFITYLRSRKDDNTAKAELAKLENISEECAKKNLTFVDVKISKVLWDDFQNSRNLN